MACRCSQARSSKSKRSPPSTSAGDSVLDATGYVVARRQATVSSKTTGKVLEVLIEEGMAVEAGQLLAVLDDSIPLAQLALAESQLAAPRHRQGCGTRGGCDGVLDRLLGRR